MLSILILLFSALIIQWAYKNIDFSIQPLKKYHRNNTTTRLKFNKLISKKGFKIKYNRFSKILKPHTSLTILNDREASLLKTIKALPSVMLLNLSVNRYFTNLIRGIKNHSPPEKTPEKNPKKILIPYFFSSNPVHR